jgi:hypothetical protein
MHTSTQPAFNCPPGHLDSNQQLPPSIAVSHGPTIAFVPILPVLQTVAIDHTSTATNPRRWLTNNYSYEDINGQVLPDAERAQEWNNEEQLVLDQIQECYLSQVRNSGKSQTLDLVKLTRKYLFLAKFRKMEDVSRLLFTRTLSQITNRLAVLKRTGIWKF